MTNQTQNPNDQKRGGQQHQQGDDQHQQKQQGGMDRDNERSGSPQREDKR